MTAITCPSGDSIRQFLLGELTEEQAESVAQHLSQCAGCAQTLNGLKVDDTLLSTLRRASVDATPGPEVERLIERFRHFAKSSDATAGDETLSPSQPAENPHDFLAPPQAADEIGRLGSYRVLQALGAGGMGVVLLAEDTKLGRRVALKVMAPSIATSPKAKERFLREARSTAKVKHDHVVTIYQVDEERGIPFLAMELLEGEPLDERLKREGRLPTADVLRIGREIAQGLAAAHKRDLLHRDIKPANIWLEGEPGASATGGRVKILDFGLARAVREETQLTQQGVIVGTPAYMAPEQGRGDEVDHRADLFSLGCVLYRAATGKAPFRGKDIVATLLSVATTVPPPPASLNPAVSPDLSDFIVKLLEKKPEDRPESAAAVVLAIAALEATPSARDGSVWNDIDVEEAAPPPPRRARKKPKKPLPVRRTPTWKLAAIAAGLSLLALGGALAGYQIIFKTDNGTLIVEVDDNAQVEFAKGKLLVRGEGNEYTLEPHPQNKKLPPGQYAIKVTGADGLSVTTPEFLLKKGDKKTIHVIVDQKWKPVPEPSNPDRRIAEWVLKAGGELFVGQTPQRIRVKTPADLPTGPIVLDTIILSGAEKKFTPADLRNLAGLTHLRTLNLYHLYETDADLQWLSEQPGISANLDAMFLTYSRVTDVGVGCLRKFPNLRALHTGSGAVGDAGLKELVAHPQLREVNLAGTSVTSAGLASLQGSRWAYLSLDFCRHVGDSGLVHLQSMKQLRSLEMIRTNVTADGVKKLAAALPQCKIVSDHGTFDPQSDAHRRAAEWVHSVGGKVLPVADGVAVKDAWVEKPSELPAVPFRLRGVDLHGVDRLTDADMDRFATLTTIDRMDLSDTPMTDAGLVRLAGLVGMKHLTLGLTGAKDIRPELISDVGMAALRNMKGLQTLNLWRRNITDAGLANLEGMNGLISVDLAQTGITDQGLAHLRGSAASLDEIVLHATKITDEGLRRLSEFKNLAHVSLNGTSVTSAGLAHLKALANLRLLQVDGTKVGDEGLRHLKTSANLESLNLRNTPVTDAGLAHLAGKARLKFLDLGLTGMTDTGLGRIKSLKSLTELRVDGTKVKADAVKKLAAEFPQCKIVSDHGTFEPSDSDRRAAEWARKHGGAVWLFRGGELLTVKLSAALPDGAFNVERIDLPTTARIGDNELAPLTRLERLHTLVLTGTPIGAAAAIHLAAIAGLTDLHLAETKVTDAGLRRLKDLPRLRLMTLSGTAVTDQGVALLGGHAALEDLNLHNTVVGDAAAAALAKCPALATLHLSSTRLTDAGLTHLAGLKSLRVLTLTGTKVTADAVKKLSAALPHCQIVSDHGTVGPKK